MQPILLAALLGVAAGRAPAAPVAAWSADTLYVGDADARAFVAVPLPGVEDAAVDDDGTILVLASGEGGVQRVVVVARDRSLRDVDVDYPSAIAAGGGVLAYVDARGVHRSRDGGAAFDTVALAPPCDECPITGGTSTDLEIDPHGTTQLVDVEVNTCTSSDFLEWQSFARVTADGRAMRSGLPQLPPPRFWAFWRFGAHGWAYGATLDGALAATDARHVEPLALPSAPRSSDPPLVATNGRIAMLWRDGLLAVADGARARVLARDTPSLDALAVDARGRALAVSDGALLRWTRRAGWETLSRAP